MDKILKIQNLLDQMLILTQEEADGLIENLRHYPEIALDQILQILEEALLRQQSMLAEDIERDEAFADNMRALLRETFLTIQKEYEEQEQAEVESILDTA